MQSRFTRSSLELRGPRNGLERVPRSYRGVRSAQFLAQMRNPPTKWVIDGGPRSRARKLVNSNPQSADP
eukprot:1965502-Alexandrium_andersonii.AAC.1